MHEDRNSQRHVESMALPTILLVHQSWTDDRRQPFHFERKKGENRAQEGGPPGGGARVPDLPIVGCKPVMRQQAGSAAPSRPGAWAEGP